MEKVIRDGDVAVLYSPGFGAGWYTWHHKLELVFSPVVVAMVETGFRSQIAGWVKELYPDAYICTVGAVDLQIEWLPVGTTFEIEEYDGSESVRLADRKWLTA